MGGADSQLPWQQKLADPSLAIQVGLKPAKPAMLTPRDVIVAAAGHDLQQQQQVVAEKMSTRSNEAEKAGEAQNHAGDASLDLDDGTMDVLWNMVMEEGTEDVDNELQEAAASAIQQHMTPIIEAELVNTVEDAIQDMATSALEEHVNFVSDEDILQAVEQVMAEGSLESGTFEDKVVSTLEEKIPAQLEAKLLETMEKELAPSGEGEESGAVSDSPEEVQQENEVNMNAKSPLLSTVPQTPLPEVIDFTPNEFLMHSDRPMSLVISTSASIPILPPDGLPYRWHLLAAFVDMSSAAIFAEPLKANSPAAAVTAETDPTIMKVALTPLRKLTPFSYKCEAPLDISYSGSRSLILVGVRYVESSEPVWDAIRLAVKVCIQAEWQVASDLNEAQASVGAALVRPTFYAPAGGGNVQLLSQLSQDLFTFYDYGNFPSRVMFTNNPTSGQLETDGNVNEDSDAQVRSTSKSVSSMRSGAADTEETVEVVSALPAPAPTMATLASAMTSLPFNPPERAVDVAPSLSRKRTLSVDDHFPIVDLASANEAAEDWIGKQDPNSDHTKTLGETVDRHCKIRFVERLANAAAAADPELKQHKPRHEPVNIDGNQSDTSDYGSIKLDASKLQQLDEDVLDALLDSVLIKFVESLVDTCASDEEMKLEINTMGYAGFALLHYAALYNMKSLIPLLLKKGADPNLQTLKGGLTPLHLAAGAGHDQICDLLARSGATVNVQDSFGLIPADSATRNGFTEIGNWLQDKKLPAMEPKVSSTNACPGNERHPPNKDITNAASESWAQNDPADVFLQSAFKGLPLKDKLGLNLFVQKYRRKANSRRQAASKESDQDDDDDDDADSMSDSNDDEEGGGRMAMARSSRSAEGDSQVHSSTSASGDGDGEDCMGNLRFISEKDRKSLKVAMSMMSKEERKELERSAPYSDVRNWMLRSNYESLREASIQLEKQAKRKTLTKVMNSETTVGQIQSGSDSQKQGTGPLRNPKLSQALAMLVLRKNLLASKGKQPSQAEDQQS
uniref:Uncharacterized protein n=1 Tax=Odontella aurita TaxID=265563 RepID=A0A7S4JWF7_9STRA